jgi:hypothetical protein
MEFQELFARVQDNLRRATPGLRTVMARMERFYIIIWYLTSEMTHRRLTVVFKTSTRLAKNDVVYCLHELIQTSSPRLLRPQMLAMSNDMRHLRISRMRLVLRIPWYSGNYQVHCLKIEELITADYECVYFSLVYCRLSHEKKYLMIDRLFGF